MKSPERKTFVAPTRSLIKRIDLGLFTGIVAVLLSFFTIQTDKQTQKARVLPIIQIDMGYQHRVAPYTYKISLTNSGPGIAYVQNVRALINDKPIIDSKKFRDALMNGRLFGYAKFEEQSAAGYLSPGESVTPWSFSWSQSSRSEIEAYLRGEFGQPLDGVDLEICYCSVFDDCWSARASDTNKPKPIKSCGRDDEQDDFFRRSMASRAAALLKSE